MGKTSCLLAALMPLVFALPALGQSATYHYSYPDPCNLVWSAVKAALNHPDLYNVKKTDDKKLDADYQPKHQVHFEVSAIIFQRENHARLSAKGTGCEMDVVSSFSGLEHDDQGDFKKRVDAALAKEKGLPPPADNSATPKPADQAPPPENSTTPPPANQAPPTK